MARLAWAVACAAAATEVAALSFGSQDDSEWRTGAAASGGGCEVSTLLQIEPSCNGEEVEVRPSQQPVVDCSSLGQERI